MEPSPNPTGAVAFEGYTPGICTPKLALGRGQAIEGYHEFSAARGWGDYHENVIKTNGKGGIRGEYTYLTIAQKGEGPNGDGHAPLRIFVCRPTWQS